MQSTGTHTIKKFISLLPLSDMQSSTHQQVNTPPRLTRALPKLKLKQARAKSRTDHIKKVSQVRKSSRLKDLDLIVPHFGCVSQDFGSLAQGSFDHSGISEEDDYSQSTSASGQQYQWQLNDGQQWVSINNDHLIEAHYCQPGAKGITLFTTDYGHIFIDFDKMEVQGGQLMVRRQTFLSHDERHEIRWYYNDNRRWYEYGSQGSSDRKASVNSSDVEQQYNTTPQGKINFRVGNISYSIDFKAMTQTNLNTRMCRRLRRRPKLNSVLKINSLAGSSQPGASPIRGSWQWQFQGDEGVWTNYSSPGCSVDSDEIERCFQRNPQGGLNFAARRFRYTLDFTKMFQTNHNTGTQRSVRRVQAEGQRPYRRPVFSSQLLCATPPAMTPPLPPSAGYTWEFLGDEGVWTDYQTPSCSVDSMEIERVYQLNQQGQTKFTAGRFMYTLNFARMCQTNDAFGTQRAVRRILKHGPQWNSSAGTPCQWQFKDVDGAWRDYTQGGCSVSSQDIEKSFQQNSRGIMLFSTGSFQYALDFSAMTQRNQSTLTIREVRRLQQ